MKKPILIIGAGPTGLVLALWLTKLGVQVRIVDKTAQPGTTSRALAVQARTLEFYQQLGFAQQVISGGVAIANLNIWAKGTRKAQVPFHNIGQGLSPYAFALVFPQDAHERLLIAQLQALGVVVERQTELLHFSQNETGVRATLRRPDGTQEVCEANYLAGCDGASSTVRQQLGIGFPGGTYSGLFYVADVEASGPVTDQNLHADLEDADFLLVFPLQGKGRLRVVGLVHDLPHDEQELTFNHVKGKAIEHLQLNVEKINWFSTYRVHHRVANRFRNGRVFLLGDAAHIHSPVGGQGMNTGIGDAVNLAWKLATVLQQNSSDTVLQQNSGDTVLQQNSGDTVLQQNSSDQLLNTYEAERIPFARRLVSTTDRAFTIVTKRGALARYVRTVLGPLLLPLLIRISFFRRFLFKTVSQIGINYRHSPLSTGAAGAVRGGDRLPWAPLGPNDDNFAPLKSLQWQVHIYGEPVQEVIDICAKFQIPFHNFPWQPQMHGIGLMRSALYLIRPDGYVALAAPNRAAARLSEYLRERSYCFHR